MILDVVSRVSGIEKSVICSSIPEKGAVLARSVYCLLVSDLLGMTNREIGESVGLSRFPAYFAKRKREEGESHENSGAMYDACLAFILGKEPGRTLPPFPFEIVVAARHVCGPRSQKKNAAAAMVMKELFPWLSDPELGRACGLSSRGSGSTGGSLRKSGARRLTSDTDFVHKIGEIRRWTGLSTSAPRKTG